jgi:hypothetical protein
MSRVTTFAVGATAVGALASTGFRVLKSQGGPDGCGGIHLLIENFDGVPPRVLPPGWVAANAIDKSRAGRLKAERHVTNTWQICGVFVRFHSRQSADVKIAYANDFRIVKSHFRGCR